MAAEDGGFCPLSQRPPLHRDPISTDTPRQRPLQTETPGRNMGPGSQTGSDIIQSPPHEQNDWQTGIKALPCHKLRLQVVITGVTPSLARYYTTTQTISSMTITHVQMQTLAPFLYTSWVVLNDVLRTRGACTKRYSTYVYPYVLENGGVSERYTGMNFLSCRLLNTTEYNLWDCGWKNGTIAIILWFIRSHKIVCVFKYYDEIN